MIKIKKQESRSDNYKIMLKQAENLLLTETDEIAGLANISALITAYLDGLNWAGFYILKAGELVLGPFQGLPACVRIPLGKGVCGSAALSQKTINVKNVHEFPGHIACDGASNSEIVLPLFKKGELYGVLDLDSPLYERFGPLDEERLKSLARIIGDFLDRC